AAKAAKQKDAERSAQRQQALQPVPLKSLGEVANQLVQELDPARLQRNMATEISRIKTLNQKEQRIAAYGKVENMVCDIVDEQWSRAMLQAKRDLQPALLSWVISPHNAKAYADAASSLKMQAPEKLVRKIFESIVSKPEIQRYIDQLAQGGSSDQTAVTESLQEVGQIVESEGQQVI
ncbi:hypothetical protein ACV22V_32515, partial [Burkholderia sp. AW33-5]